MTTSRVVYGLVLLLALVFAIVASHALTSRPSRSLADCGGGPASGPSYCFR